MDYQIENISVAARIRPLLPFDSPQCAAWDPLSFTSLKSLKTDKKFNLDKVYGMNSTTQRVFDEMCEAKIWKAMEGYNCCIACYGQTGSGKTFTMCGRKKSPGIIPLTIQTIFSYIEDTPGREFLMRCSYCEIYNECINDLLNPLNCNLPLMDDKNRGPVIVGLTEEVCRTSDQIFAILKIGDAHKQVASTSYNLKSTRSHCIFRILIESRERNDTENINIGVVTLFDLAGSEGQKVSVEPERSHESKFINKSILALSNVILKLSEGKTHILLRESKLTRIIGPLILGEAKIIIIGTLNPTSDAHEESLNTLHLCKKSKSIIQTLKKNPGLGEVSYLWKYKTDMMLLKEKLEGISGINSLKSSVSEEDEEEKVSIEVQIENLQTAILVSEMIRDGKMQSGIEEDLLYDLSERRSLRLKYWRESNSTLRNSSLEEVEEEDSLPTPLFPRISDVRMSIPEEPSVNALSPFESKQHLEMFRPSDDHALNLGSELLHKPGVPMPHPDWLQLILDQESLITELQAQLAVKLQENTVLKEEVKFCKEKLISLKAKLIS